MKSIYIRLSVLIITLYLAGCVNYIPEDISNYWIAEQYAYAFNEFYHLKGRLPKDLFELRRVIDQEIARLAHLNDATIRYNDLKACQLYMERNKNSGFGIGYTQTTHVACRLNIFGQKSIYHHRILVSIDQWKKWTIHHRIRTDNYIHDAHKTIEYEELKSNLARHVSICGFNDRNYTAQSHPILIIKFENKTSAPIKVVSCKWPSFEWNHLHFLYGPYPYKNIPIFDIHKDERILFRSYSEPLPLRRGDVTFLQPGESLSALVPIRWLLASHLERWEEVDNLYMTPELIMQRNIIIPNKYKEFPIDLDVGKYIITLGKQSSVFEVVDTKSDYISKSVSIKKDIDSNMSKIQHWLSIQNPTDTQYLYPEERLELFRSFYRSGQKTKLWNLILASQNEPYSIVCLLEHLSGDWLHISALKSLTISNDLMIRRAAFRAFARIKENKSEARQWLTRFLLTQKDTETLRQIRHSLEALK